MMSKTKEGNLDENKSRVQVDNLEQQERKLKNHEAESVKGGGGPSGGVLHYNIGEEIPS
jgi:hypothetical protein